MTTVLLVPARPGKSVPPVGVLTKTARTFVQDGASTEYATQVVGTTLDNGRLYARILSTSSRVFYDKEPSPDSHSPYVVYPSKTPQDDWQLRVALDNAPLNAIKDTELIIEESESVSRSESVSSSTSTDDSNDVFNKKNDEKEIFKFKPARAKSNNLPTYTVKQDYFTGIEETEEEERNYKPRIPKLFKPQPKPTARKIDSKPLSTVTYHGFADFTTTVGDTVIVFSPSTSPVPVGRPATTIKGDATLRPDDGVAVIRIRPTSVVTDHKSTESPSLRKPTIGSKRLSKDPLLDAINGGIEPSVVDEPEVESSKKSTPLLLIPDLETGSVKPTGLLKVIDSTTARDGTTTHLKSFIYGTFIGTNYARIISTSTNVYFFPDESTVSYGTEETTSDYTTTDADNETDQPTTLELPKTTQRIPTTTEEGDNELTTPYKETTTSSVLTTLRGIFNSAKKVSVTTEPTVPTSDNEIVKRVRPLNNLLSRRGNVTRTTTGKPPPTTPKNAAENESKKLTLATRLLPSTVYKTYTYFTTFFLPGENDHTSTSVRSREVVSSEVTYLTELIRPTAGLEPSPSTSAINSKPPATPTINSASNRPKEETTTQDQEIELIFKTLYTTFTYLTTFFQESTSSISSREVVETNVITHTVGPDGLSAEVAGLFDKESAGIKPTKAASTIKPSARPSFKPAKKIPNSASRDASEIDTTEEYPVTSSDLETTVDGDFTSEGVTDQSLGLEPSPTPGIPTAVQREQVKTYFTTVTYFTTIFVDDETEIETRTEVLTNVVTDRIKPTAVVEEPSKTQANAAPKPNQSNTPTPDILAYLEAIRRQKSSEEALVAARNAQGSQSTVSTTNKPALKEPVTVENPSLSQTTTSSPLTTLIDDESIPTTTDPDEDSTAAITPNPTVDDVIESMVTDVTSSTSSGGGTLLDTGDKKNSVPDDQELSETNHHDVEPAPTLLLQTSYTTFTYFTTMYKGDNTNVVSRLETITDVVTETIRPTAVIPAESSTLPVTFYTTFTYWTTFYQGGNTVTTSREEIISSVDSRGVSPTPTVKLGVIMTYRPGTGSSSLDDDYSSEKEQKVPADNEIAPVGKAINKFLDSESSTQPKVITVIPQKEEDIQSTTIDLEPTTYYTTFTYFTTSYIGTETILNSRLETITNISPAVSARVQATGRSISDPASDVQLLKSSAKNNLNVEPTKSSNMQQTGLISSVRSSKVNDGKTTHYATDVYGTYIDGLYAQVIESSSKVETSTAATPVLPTGVISLNKGSVIDADKVTTIYFTTQQVGTLIDGLYAKVIESTSSTKIDQEKKSSISPVHGHRTGLVRIIAGQVEANGTTTAYQSKVIGTSIDGRYAQIIESTSSFHVKPTASNISPTSTLPPNAATGIPGISPSPAVIQSSISDDLASNNSADNEDDEEGDDKLKKKKSRLPFSSRKSSFTPAIRPFASRSRPTFNPKRKNVQAATIITRTDITPTVTATLAGKSNRFASSRGRVSSPAGPYSSTLSSSGSRRFSGRRSSTQSSSYSSTFPSGSSRSRAPVKISPTSTFAGGARSGRTSAIRPSSLKSTALRSSSALPNSSSRFRVGIRPSSTINRSQASAKQTDQEDDANEFTATTLPTEETLVTDPDEAGETSTTPLSTTTEAPRRSTNPLLRFRRPINVGANRSTTPRPVTTTTKRSRTTPTFTSRNASRNRTASVSPRTRQSQSGLLPPRSFFNRRTEQTEEPTTETARTSPIDKDTEVVHDNPVQEISDNDYEGSEDKATAANVSSSRQSRGGNPVQIRPFGRRLRARRQASQSRSTSQRFRRPVSRAEERSDEDDYSPVQEEPVRVSQRYTSRNKPQSPKNYDSSAESSEYNYQDTSREKLNGRGNARVKPTPTIASSRQFTLREKESTNTGRSTYKRPSSTSRGTSRATNYLSNLDSSRSRSTRLRTSPGRTSVDSSRKSGRPTSRTSKSRTSNRRLPSQRLRGLYSESNSPVDRSITVTHYIPTEVTIPVVNNGITEHKNIITAKPSTEILGPHQFSTVVGGDGKPLVVIVSEATGTNPHGQMEITRFLLHETPTTRVSHTLTTVGGRKISQSIIVPSTVYSVENIISTIQPALPGGNSPLANILLSRLLLDQLGPAKLVMGDTTSLAPTTQYSTRTTSYVTTITSRQSTVIPLTFRGKEIMTTLVETSTNVVTATEFITDTVVVTPTATLPQASFNSLLLLLQQQQLPQQPLNPLDPLFAAAPSLTQSNTLPGEQERRHQPADLDYKQSSEYEDDQSEEESVKSNGRKSRKEDATSSSTTTPESTVITLYVSGKRPGEFSTVLSTVKNTEAPSVSRRRRQTQDNVEVKASVPPSLFGGSDTIANLASSEEFADTHSPTQSLESVVGDVGRHISTSIRI